MIEAILDKLFPYKVKGVFYAVTDVTPTTFEQYWRRAYWKKRFLTQKSAENFIKRGLSPLGHNWSETYAPDDLRLLGTEDNGKTYIVWDDTID